MRQTFAAMLILGAVAACGNPEPVDGSVTIVIHDEFPYAEVYGYARPDCKPADIKSYALQASTPPRIKIHDDDGKELYDEEIPAKAPYDSKDKTCKVDVTVKLKRDGDVKIEIRDEYDDRVDEKTLPLDERSVTFVV